MNVSREKINFDVVIVGAGPAGLAAAIRLGQLNQQHNKNISICVLEKGASVGAHILSGAVLEPRALNELIPDWQQLQSPVTVPAREDRFYLLTKNRAWRLPTPTAMRNHGNFIISLGRFCQWLAQQAELLGVQIFTGFAASKILFADKRVIGVQTNDFGLNRQQQPTPQFQAGIEIHAKQTIFSEGCRGYLSEQLINHFNLRAHADPQTYAIGIKELWRIDSQHHQAGLITHTVGWPLDRNTYGGSFIYHFEKDLLALGFVIGLDYQNPYLNPYEELQRFKLHPLVQPLLTNGTCLNYGARALNEGGWQSRPTLSFPGGCVIGCAAGFLNVPKIKGTHTAMKSGMLAAELIFEQTDLAKPQPLPLDEKIKHSWIASELWRVRNVRPAFHFGLWCGLGYAAFDQYLLRGRAPWTFHYRADHVNLTPKAQAIKINYPKHDGKITFDLTTQVYLSGTHHREDQPCHLKLKDPNIPIEYNLKNFDAPEQRYCPAGVYEIVHKENQPQLQINFANCVHCKTCDIKDPLQNIIWTTPEGGDGPNYQNM